jgi:hypothetical protein
VPYSLRLREVFQPVSDTEAIRLIESLNSKSESLRTSVGSDSFILQSQPVYQGETVNLPTKKPVTLTHLCLPEIYSRDLVDLLGQC